MIVEDERDGVWAWAVTGLAYLVGAALTVVIAVGVVVVMVVAACRTAETTGDDRAPANGRR
jgi:uncharacterized membrane protein